MSEPSRCPPYTQASVTMPPVNPPRTTMTPIDPDAPAFPVSKSSLYPCGISTRTYLAGLAMQGLLAGNGVTLGSTAHEAVIQADNLIVALNLDKAP